MKVLESLKSSKLRPLGANKSVSWELSFHGREKNILLAPFCALETHRRLPMNEILERKYCRDSQAVHQKPEGATPDSQDILGHLFFLTLQDAAVLAQVKSHEI